MAHKASATAGTNPAYTSSITATSKISASPLSVYSDMARHCYRTRCDPFRIRVRKLDSEIIEGEHPVERDHEHLHLCPRLALGRGFWYW